MLVDTSIVPAVVCEIQPGIGELQNYGLSSVAVDKTFSISGRG